MVDSPTKYRFARYTKTKFLILCEGIGPHMNVLAEVRSEHVANLLVDALNGIATRALDLQGYDMATKPDG